MSIVHEEAAKVTNLAAKATMLADRAQMVHEDGNNRRAWKAAESAARTARTMRALMIAAQKHAWAAPPFILGSTADDEAAKATAFALIVTGSDDNMSRTENGAVLGNQLIAYTRQNLHASATGACLDLADELFQIVQEDANFALPEEG